MAAANIKLICIHVQVNEQRARFETAGWRGATSTPWRQTEAAGCELTSHSDSEAAGSFVTRAVKHSVGHLVEPLWEVWFRSFPFQDNAAGKKRERKESESALIRHLLIEDQSLTRAKSNNKRKLFRLGRLVEAGLTLWGCRLRCRRPPVCPRSLWLSAFLAPPTCLSHEGTWSLEGPYLQKERFSIWGVSSPQATKFSHCCWGFCCPLQSTQRSAYLKFSHF